MSDGRQVYRTGGSVKIYPYSVARKYLNFAVDTSPKIQRKSTEAIIKQQVLGTGQ